MGLCYSCCASRPSPPITSTSSQNQDISNNNSIGVEFSTTTTATGSTFAPSQPSEQWSVASELRNTSGQILETPNLRVYTFAELKTATKNFRPDTVLGQGGFGKVYKGWMDEKTLAPSKMGSGMVVAIKKLNPESLQGFEEWKSEVIFLGRLSHPNLVRLLGYCSDDKELLLVYEFMPKGSLENHLFRRNPAVEPLSWNLRLKIVIGAARGLAFLHGSDSEVIYRDFKASNILLDSDYNAKISDFGLAKLGPSGEKSHVTTRIMGTYGYAAPEYMATGHLYVKSDVYAFGVVLLEIMTALRAHDTRRPDGQKSLVDWLSPSLSNKKKLMAIMDNRIKGQYSSKAAMEMAQITLKCVDSDPKKRPSMTEVVDVLENIGRMEIPERSVPSAVSNRTPRNHWNGYRAKNSERRSPVRARASPGHWNASFPAS